MRPLCLSALVAFTVLFPALPSRAQGGLPLPVMPARTTPVGLPQDAGPHDTATIEWWYFNSFLTTESGKRYAVIGSFFRTGLSAQKKGHYLLYALADLDANTKTAYSVLDTANLALLKGVLPLLAMQKPDDPRPLQLLSALQNNRLPKPHRLHPGPAKVRTKPLFAISFGKNWIAQAAPDARTWKANLSGDDFTLSLRMEQETGRPPMLVGGEGKTGLNRPDDMFYVSLTRMTSAGTLTRNGVTEKVTGIAWVDRQWGSSWVVGDNGWDWFGLQLDDGSDLIVYRITDNATGRVLRAEATLLRKDGTQIVDKAPTFAASGTWTDPVTKIAYPQTFTITMPTAGLSLTATPAFDAQTIPVIGIGDAIWEGVVNVTGTGPNGAAITGRGYRELVGYRSKPAAAAVKGPRTP